MQLIQGCCARSVYHSVEMSVSAQKKVENSAESSASPFDVSASMKEPTPPLLYSDTKKIKREINHQL